MSMMSSSSSMRVSPSWSARTFWRTRDSREPFIGGGKANFTCWSRLVGIVALTSGCCSASAARRELAQGCPLRQPEVRLALAFFFADLEDLALLALIFAFLAWPEECVDLNEA